MIGTEREHDQSDGREKYLGVLIGAPLVYAFGGAAAAAASQTHAWGVAAIPVWIVVIASFMFLSERVTAAARAHTARRAVPLAGAVFGAALVGEVLFVTLVTPGSVSGWFSTRWVDGVEMFGAGSWRLGGWLWALCFAARLGIECLLTLGVVLIVSSTRAYCRGCSSFATRRVWRVDVRGFSKELLSLVKEFRELLGERADPDERYGVRLDLKTCVCAQVCELKAAGHNIDDDMEGDRVFNELELSAYEAVRLIEWACENDETVVPPDDGFDITRLREVTKEPIGAPVIPERGEWGSLLRVTGSLLGMEWYRDTEYTRALRKRLGMGDWRAVDEALGHITNANDRACVLEAAGDWTRRPAWLDDWLEDAPQSATALTVSGINWVKLAWRERGGGWEPKNVEEFWGNLRRAMGDLDRATEIDPDARVAHAWKIYAAKGLQMGSETGRAYFDAAVSGDPDMLAAHWMYFDMITPKWGGSVEALGAFSSERVAALPEGSGALAVVGFCHLEIANAVARSEGAKAGMAYLASGAVRDEIVRANRKMMLRHRMSMVTPRARAMMAYMLWRAGDLEGARAHMRAIGRSTPWDPWTPGVFFWSADTCTKGWTACGAR